MVKKDLNMCGILGSSKIPLRSLTEGITVYKQKMYDTFLGTRLPNNMYPYPIPTRVAKFIGDIIGTDELVSKHFNHDYDGIKASFQEKTGNDLDKLVLQLNKLIGIRAQLISIIPLYRQYYFPQHREKLFDKMQSIASNIGMEYDVDTQTLKPKTKTPTRDDNFRKELQVSKEQSAELAHDTRKQTHSISARQTNLIEKDIND